ncbi:MAG: ATP-dependent helicase [Solirubrobacteraceae bacterium]
MSALERSEAVRHRGGPLVMTAAAGTGKTTLIAERFLWLVEQGTEPSRIAIVAPSRSRAEALRERLETELTRGYEELLLGTAVDLAAAVVDRTGTGPGGSESVMALLGPGDRLAMLMERLDQLELSHHDFAGSPAALLGQFVRRIDCLKAELISAEEFAAWAAPLGASDGQLEREFAGVYAAHEALVAEAAAQDAGDLVRDASRVCETKGEVFEHVLVDDAHELDFAAATLVRVLGRHLWVAGDPAAGLNCLRAASGARMAAFAALDGARVISLARSFRSRTRLREAASLLIGGAGLEGPVDGELAFWRCANRRAQAQVVAADIERLLTREGVAGNEIVVLVPDGGDDGRSVAAALEERAVGHRVVGEAAFFQRAEIRDLLAWLRLLVDPTDAPAAVRVLARPPVELRSVDIARCTQIARRRKLDMVAALAAATESPQVPPEARERIRSFLKLYRAAVPALDNTRPEVFVHRLIERLGLRRQQLFAAQADVVERLQALARFGELAAAHGRRAPQSTPREFARSIAAVAQFGLPEQEEPRIAGARMVQVVPFTAAGGLEAEHVYVLGLNSSLHTPAPQHVPDALLKQKLPAASEPQRAVALRQALYVAISRARTRVVMCCPAPGTQATTQAAPAAPIEELRRAFGAAWDDKPEELFGPAETLHSTYRLLRDDLLDATMRVGGRLGELRLDTDLDISHAVVRYLELLKVAALVARPEEQSLAEALRDVNARILQAATAEQKEILSSSALDDYLLDSEWDTRRRAQMLAARDEPSLEPFLPRRGEGIALSASDIDTYRTCPLRYKFARVFRIPQEPSVHQRFGIVVHQVLERFHARTRSAGTLAELLGLLEASWRRAGFADSEEERQLRGKAASALMRYHARFQVEEAEPVWFERPFTFRLGPHILRGRVDRVDRLPDGQYELIDYKTGRPKSSSQLADDVQLSVYALGAREAWQLDASRQAYYYLLDDEKVALPDGDEDRSEWVREAAREVAEGILAQEFEPTPSFSACSVCDYRLLCPAAEV